MKTAEEPAPKLGCGCPGSSMMTMNRAPQAALQGAAGGFKAEQASQLGHWPVKLRLVPAEAPFLRGAEVVIAADCAPVALPDFNSRLSGKVVMIACPKFDDPQPYLQKLTDMFRNAGLKKVQILRMEVPCCTGLSTLVRQAAELAGTGVPVEDLIVTREGRLQPAQSAGLMRQML